MRGCIAISDTSLIFNAIFKDRGVSAGLAKTSGQLSGLATVGSARMRLLGAAIAAVTPHVIALGQSAVYAGGALALMPAGLTTLIGTAVAAKVAFSGLGNAWKATGAAATAGGGSATDAAHQVELATRGVRDATFALSDAQLAAMAAQDALTRAREDEAERLEDLARSVAEARLDERGAILAVEEAKRRIATARGSGDALEIKQAQLAYERSKLTLEQVRDTVSDLGKKQAEASAAGIEGSDAVQSAIQRQEQAQRALVAATERLADAQRDLAKAGTGGGGGTDKAAAALAKLAPSAAALIIQLRAMGPAWSAAGKAAQQATFDGVAGDFKALGDTYLPMVSVWLKRTGDGFNGLIRSVAGLALSRKFANDFGNSMGLISEAADRINQAVRPLLNGFMQFTAVGAGAMPGLADMALKTAERFERWAIAARESGQMQQWISDGVTNLGKFWQLTKNLVGDLGALFKAGENSGTLDGLIRGTAAIKAWLESAEGSRKMGEILAYVRDILASLASIIDAVVEHGDIMFRAFGLYGDAIAFVARNLDTLAPILPVVVTAMLAYKTAQMGIAVVHGLMAAKTWAVVASQKALVFAQTSGSAAARFFAIQTTSAAVATTAGDAATKRSLVSLAALKIAQGASAVATGISTAAQWALNTAWYGFPVVWVIAAILALIAVIVLIIVYHKEIWAWVVKTWNDINAKLMAFGNWLATELAPKIFEWLSWPFRKAWEFITWVWEQQKIISAAVVAWIVEKFMTVVDFFTSLPGRVRSAAAGLWDGITDSFKGMINFLIRGWNSLDFAINLKVPDWIPASMGGGKSWSIPDIIPDLPYLDVGGRVSRSGLAVIHQGEDVVPAAEVRQRESGGFGGRQVHELRGGDAFGDMVLDYLRKAIGDRGGDPVYVLSSR